MTLVRAMVTGGAGFIGSHLVDRLIELGHEVTVVDNLATGRLANLRAHVDNPRFRMVQADVAEPGALSSVMPGVTWVFHLAALADIVPSIQRPLDYFRANVDGTAHVLEAARHAGVKRFVYAASSSCYGIPETFPTPETAAIQPRYPYALSKYLGEETARHWCDVYGMPVVSLRFFNVYGPRARTTGAYGAVLGVFLAQKLAGKPFTVVGDGTQTRDFTFVTDVVEALIAAAQSSVSGRVFNVGSGQTRSVNELVRFLGGPVTFVPKRPGEPDCTFADISRIGAALGWRPRVSFEEGVDTMLRHIDDWRDAPVWDPELIAIATKDWFEHLSSRGREEEAG